jgi:sugar fermentation stimulation protein A
VLVDTSLPNRIVEEGIRRGRVSELAGYDRVRREVPYGQRSRIDLLLEGPPDGRGRGNGRPRTCHVEIKSNTMASSVESRRSDFPDSPTERGLRHLEELTALARRGQRAVQFYLVGRTDCGRAGFAEEIDPAYAEAAGRADEAGVEFLAYRAEIRQDRITVGRRCELAPPLAGKGWR